MSSVEYREWQTKLTLDGEVSELMTTQSMDYGLANAAIWTEHD